MILGLAIGPALARAMGGELAVPSTPGEVTPHEMTTLDFWLGDTGFSFDCRVAVHRDDGVVKGASRGPATSDATDRATEHLREVRRAARDIVWNSETALGS